MRTECVVVGIVYMYMAYAPQAQSVITFHCNSRSTGKYDEPTIFDSVFITPETVYSFECPADGDNGRVLSYEDDIEHDNIKFVNSVMAEIPSQIFLFSPRNLSLVQCGIKRMNRSLEYAYELSELNLAQNNITELTNDAFDHHYRPLLTLNLTANSISVIESFAFVFLPSLTVLLLAQNKLQTLPGNVFTPLTVLSTINLASNELRVLEEGLFSTNAHLTTIQLQNNQINTVDENVFYNEADSQLSSLEYIILSDNNITEINIPNVRVPNLILNNNRITHIHISSKVHYLQAENNRISSITFDNVSEAELQQLKLKNNSISSLDVHTATLDVLKNQTHVKGVYCIENPHKGHSNDWIVAVLLVNGLMLSLLFVSLYNKYYRSRTVQRNQKENSGLTTIVDH
ncbi:leucine-rich repeat-containing protein 15-like [Anopheles cruzii]|uniref:leucine-rich repeat-containing protein 15-like n=1 Tax=Anopheles cruzii TaxID=68878 RepID=UPI0022EC2700|nr:leucine-rich repeat-containing protein 15-like [Anopheles cruzii]